MTSGGIVNVPVRYHFLFLCYCNHKSLCGDGCSMLYILGKDECVDGFPDSKWTLHGKGISFGL